MMLDLLFSSYNFVGTSLVSNILHIKDPAVKKAARKKTRMEQKYGVQPGKYNHFIYSAFELREYYDDHEKQTCIL